MHRALRRLPLVAIVVTAIVVFPLGVLASHQFGDVPDSNQFHDDIEALAASGVTLGCGGGNFCPSAYVTREQMAAFLNRLGALADGRTPVVNAAQVDGVDEVLGAGPIVLAATANWTPTGNASLTVTNMIDATAFESASTGQRAVHLGLPAPNAIGLTDYGLASVEVCMHPSIGVSISQTVVRRLAGGSATAVIDDPTDRTLTLSCYTLTDPDPNPIDGGANVEVTFDYAQAPTNAWLRQVTTTWVPLD